MKRVRAATAAAVPVFVGMLLTGAAVAATPFDDARERLDVSTGVVAREQLDAVVELGIDRHQLELSRAGRRAKDGSVRVETILSGRQAARLRRQGIALAPKRVGGDTVAQRATARAVDGFEVFRPYAGPGGLEEGFEEVAAAHPDITKLVTYGQTVNERDLIALRSAATPARGATARSARCSTSAPSTPASGLRRR